MLEPKLAPLEDEEAYRRRFMTADAVQVFVIIGVLGAASLVFIRDDLALLGKDPRVLHVFINRLITGAVLTGAASALSRARTGASFDRTLALMLAAIVGSSAHVFLVQPPNFVAHLPINLLLVALLWFVMPGPIVTRGAAALALSIIAAFSRHPSEVPPVAARSLELAHVLVHLIGLPIAMRYARLRRDQFKSQLAEDRTRAQLVVEKDRAEALARAKSDFLATMSHEFRTPMNAVLGLSEVLMHSNLPRTEHEHVRAIHQSANGLLVLINDILEHAKLSAGHLELNPVPIDIEALAQNALDTVRYRAEAKGLVLALTMEPGTPRHVLVDETRLRQILVNLLSNAVKFTDRGSVKLIVAPREVSADKHTLAFSVTDTGMGILPENLERIFSPFEQEGSKRVGNRGGTGLGLAISRNLAKLMGGTLTAQSSPGKGSTFELVFPAPEVDAPATKETAVHTTNVAATPLRILIAEDNDTNQRVAVAMLAQLGQHADIVGNGLLAVEAATRTPYDVIFLDRHMPELDGLEAARRIRAVLGSKPYLMALTAAAFPEDRAQCFEAGMDDFIAKPLRLAELREALVRARERGVSANATSDLNILESPAALYAPPPISVTPATSTATSTATNSPDFDPAPLEPLRALAEMGEPEFLTNLVRDFIRNWSAEMERFPELIAAGDAATFKRLVHSMKSAAASLGAMRVSATCLRLEKLSKPETLDTCPPLVAQLKDEFAAATRWLEEQIAKP